MLALFSMLVLSKAMTDHEGGTIPELAERITERVETIEDFIKKQWFHDFAQISAEVLSSVYLVTWYHFWTRKGNSRH